MTWTFWQNLKNYTSTPLLSRGKIKLWIEAFLMEHRKFYLCLEWSNLGLVIWSWNINETYLIDATQKIQHLHYKYFSWNITLSHFFKNMKQITVNQRYLWVGAWGRTWAVRNRMGSLLVEEVESSSTWEEEVCLFVEELQNRAVAKRLLEIDGNP